MSIRSWAADDRPREKLVRHGARALSDAELVAILLRTGGGRGTSAVDVARAVLHEVGGLHRLAGLDVDRLRGMKGMGPVKAITLCAAEELARRWAAPRSATVPQCGSSQEFFALYGPRLARRPQEELLVVSLNARYQVLREDVAARGDSGGASVHPRAIYAAAIAASAAAIALLHNHPSGDPAPSEADRECTARLAAAGRLIGIPLLDHLIIGDGAYFSFRDAGLLV